MAALAGRYQYAICDFSNPHWTRAISGPFDAAVSSIAIHNVNSPNIIRGIYDDAYTLVRPGGCFLTFDRREPPLEDQRELLRVAGFKAVQCFWQDQHRALFGGFRE